MWFYSCEQGKAAVTTRQGRDQCEGTLRDQENTELRKYQHIHFPDNISLLF